MNLKWSERDHGWISRPRDETWLNSARLAVIGWTSYGTYRVRAEAALH